VLILSSTRPFMRSDMMATEPSVLVWPLFQAIVAVLVWPAQAW